MEPRYAVRDGLRRLLTADPQAWPGANALVFRGRLLDEVGSDARPLVVLLAKVAEWGVVEQLREAGQQGGSWDKARGPLVVTMVNDHYLQPEMAQWSVETWAYALGMVTEAQLTPGIGRERPAVSAPPSAPPRLAVGATPNRGGRATRPAALAGLGVPARSATPYRPANAPLGYKPPRPNTGALPYQQGAQGPSARMVRGVVWGTGGFMVIAAGIFAWMIVRTPATPAPTRTVATLGDVAAPLRSSAPSPESAPPAPSPLLGIAPVLAPSGTPRAAPPAPAAVGPANPSGQAAAALAQRYGTYAPAYAAGTGRTGAVPFAATGAGRLPEATTMGIPRLPTALPGATNGALPSSPRDSQRLFVVQPPVRATLPQERLVPLAGTANERPGLGLLNVGTGKLDRVLMRDGRVLQGRVEVVRASVIQFIQADTRLRYEIPKAQIAEIQTEFGNRVRFTSEAGRNTPIAVRMGPLVTKGVGGSYRVQYDVQSVTGSPECRGLWRTAPKPDVVVVQHVPASDTLVMAVDGGGRFSAAIDAQGVFATSILPQPEASIGSSAITSRMNGQFTSAGFTGQVTIVGYRRQPTGQDITCVSVLNADAAKQR